MTKYSLFQDARLFQYLKITQYHQPYYRVKKKDYMIILIDTEKEFDKIQYLDHNQNSQKNRNRGGYSSAWSSICTKDLQVIS